MSMPDLTRERLIAAIEPRSDQINYEDMIAGPRDVEVAGVSAGTKEQPVQIRLAGEARYYRPCKTMTRLLVALWGDDGRAWVGRRLRLVGDPNVMFGGVRVGGIRISHASHIDHPHTVALSVARGKRAPHTVQPLPEPLRSRMARAGLTEFGRPTTDRGEEPQTLTAGGRPDAGASDNQGRSRLPAANSGEKSRQVTDGTKGLSAGASQQPAAGIAPQHNLSPEPDAAHSPAAAPGKATAPGTPRQGGAGSAATPPALRGGGDGNSGGGAPAAEPSSPAKTPIPAPPASRAGETGRESAPETAAAPGPLSLVDADGVVVAEASGPNDWAHKLHGLVSEAPDDLVARIWERNAERCRELYRRHKTDKTAIANLTAIADYCKNIIEAQTNEKYGEVL